MSKNKVKNKSAMFLLPMLGFTPDTLPPEFQNCYYNEDDNIVLEFSHHVLDDPDIIEIKNKNNIVYYIFNVPSEFLIDFNYFKESKYSKFRPNLKKRIVELYGYKSDPSEIVLKAPERKKWLEDKIGMELPDSAEIASALIKEREYIEI